MEYVSGEILTVEGLKKGYLGIENQVICEEGNGVPPQRPVCTGVILPTFVNAHTHIGDAFIRLKNIPLPRDLEALVAPPHGLKHQLLEKTDQQEIIVGMRRAIHEMIHTGITWFCDFRENGITGIQLLKEAIKTISINPVILARPRNLSYDREEIEQLLQYSDGIGVSSISDWEYEELKKLADHTKRKRKLFSLHASERIRENIDEILDLNPDFIVHMLYATESDLLRVKDQGIPIVICPRSNAFFQLKPNFHLLKQTGVEIMIGTDNAMLHPPVLLDEIKYIRQLTDLFTLEQLLTMVTYTPRKILNLEDCIPASNFLTSLVVVDKQTLEIKYIARGLEG